MACKFSLVLTQQDTLQLAILVDDVFNHHNNSLYDVVSKLELGTYHCLKASGLGCHL